MLRYNKKAQISDTMTWIIATIIIIVSLSFFIFLADGLARGGAIKNAFDTAFFGVDFELDKEINAKTDAAFKINKLNEDKIKEWINEIEK